MYYSNAALTVTYTKANAASEASVYADWSKKGYRLPTKAEWEYAARYIDGTSWSGGDHVSRDTSAPSNTSTVIGDYTWCYSNSGNSSQEVGQKTANALGLRDMTMNGAMTGRLTMTVLLKVSRLGPRAVVFTCILAVLGTTAIST